MEDRCDVIVIGGGIVGCATAYFLSSNPDFSGSVIVLEPDPAYTYSSSTLSASSIRTQFSNALNIKISQYGFEVLTSFHDLMSVENDRPDLKFHAGGYLFLAETDAQVAIMKQNYSVQLANDADVVLWSPSELASSFPHLNVADIKLASYGRSGEGWFDNADFLNGFKRKAESLGVRFIKDEAIGFNVEKQSLKSVKLKSGKKIEADYFVNAAGSRAGKIAKYAGIMLDHIQEDFHLHRLQASVRGQDKIANRFVKWLGFKEEGIMERYGPNKADYIRYARLV